MPRFRLAALTWPFPFGVRLGWATADAPNPPLGEARGRAYLLRGQAVVFSRGFGAMCGAMRRAGLWAEDLRCVGDRWARRHLRRHPHRGPLVLIGHSCGGRYALYTAEKLEALGVTIDLLVCIDVALPYPVPGNVREAVHIYRSRWRVYPAGPLRAAGSGARVVNVDLDADGSPIDPAGLHHLNITASPAVQAWVMRRALAVAG